VSLIARENNFNVKMSLEKSGTIKLESGDTEIGNSEIEITADVQGSEQVGLNATYFIEALQVIPQEEVRI
jgi:DNA polymerase III sliding clamp (beta) subunit (PCNA family)